MEVKAKHERQQVAGASSGWEESHRLDIFVPDQSLALSLQIAVRPHWGKASYLAAVLEADALPVVIAETDIPAPAAGWEVRASGLWADHICETPLDHWSYGLEAFALAVDDPSELLGRAIGDRVPLGWELEFEASDSAEVVPSEAGLSNGQGSYRQLGRSHGILLSSDGEREFDGLAVRSHRWGTGLPPNVVVGELPATATAVVLPDLGTNWHLSRGDNGSSAIAEIPAPGHSVNES